MRRVLERRAEFDNDRAVIDAVDKYTKFLSSARLSETPREPTLLVDLVWHTHMQMPRLYWTDCARIAGTIVDHIDDM